MRCDYSLQLKKKITSKSSELSSQTKEKRKKNNQRIDDRLEQFKKNYKSLIEKVLFAIHSFIFENCFFPSF